MIAKFDYTKDTPLFLVENKVGIQTTVAFKVRYFLKLVVVNLGLNPSQYTFHMFCRSGASMAFDNDVQFENIKQHGNWQSEAIWHYLKLHLKLLALCPQHFNNF